MHMIYLRNKRIYEELQNKKMNWLAVEQRRPLILKIKTMDNI